ncbi:MAG: hypothetical protein ACM3RP_01620 [Chitinophagales bacterium]
MKKLAIVLSAAMVFGAASAALAADPAKISGEVVFKGMFGRNDSMTQIHPKTWETGKLSASGSINPQLSYTFGVKYDMPSAGSTGVNNWPGASNGLALQFDKAALTYTHKSLPLSVTLGKLAMAGARTNYWDIYSNNLGAEGVELKATPVQNLTLQALVQPFDKEDSTSVSMPSIFADYKTALGEFGLNLNRTRDANGTYIDYSVEGTVPVGKSPVTAYGELIKKHNVDEFNYIVGAKATLGANTLFVETTDQAYGYDHTAKQTVDPIASRIRGTAIGVSRTIAGGIQAKATYAMMENGSSKATGEMKVSF